MTTSEDISSGWPYRTTGDCVGVQCEGCASMKEGMKRGTEA